MAAAAERLPFLGAGVSWRPAWRWEVIRHRGDLGAVEYIVEDLAGPRAVAAARDVRAAVPVLLHGLALSLGSAEGLDPERVGHLARTVEALEPPWVSEHIAFTRAGEVDIGHLLPLPFTREAVETVAGNVARLRAAIPGVPLCLENIAYTIALPGAEMDEAAFVRAVVEACDCGLLLDLENVHANARNHGYGAEEFLAALPLERVIEVHLAGGVVEEGTYCDTHSRPVPEASWRLLEWLAPRASPRVVIIERDDDLPPFGELLDEVRRAASILSHATERAPAPAGR